MCKTALSPADLADYAEKDSLVNRSAKADAADNADKDSCDIARSM